MGIDKPERARGIRRVNARAIERTWNGNKLKDKLKIYQMRFTVTRMTCPLSSCATKNDLQSIVQPKDFSCAIKMQLPVHVSSNTRQRDDLFSLKTKNRLSLSRVVPLSDRNAGCAAVPLAAGLLSRDANSRGNPKLLIAP